MSNQRHISGPASPVDSVINAARLAKANAARQANASVIEQLPDTVRPQPYPKVLSISPRVSPMGEKYLEMQVFMVGGIFCIPFAANEWDELVEKAATLMPGIRSPLEIAQPGDIAGLTGG